MLIVRTITFTIAVSFIELRGFVKEIPQTIALNTNGDTQSITRKIMIANIAAIIHSCVAILRKR